MFIHLCTSFAMLLLSVCMFTREIVWLVRSWAGKLPISCLLILIATLQTIKSQTEGRPQLKKGSFHNWFDPPPFFGKKNVQTIFCWQIKVSSTHGGQISKVWSAFLTLITLFCGTPCSYKTTINMATHITLCHYNI